MNHCGPLFGALLSSAAAHSTGKERDSESGNDYFGARYYASSMGRFLSPDPTGLLYADPTNPQSLNLYAYVLNNPLKFVDPTGLDCVYLNDSGDGIESLDQQSNSDECTQNGGYWAQGAITNFQVNDNGSYTFTSLDANLNTLYTNFSGSGNTNSFVNLDVMSYFANYQIQQQQLQQAPPTSNQYLQAIAQTTGNLPNVCGLGVAGYIGGGRLGVGGSLDTSNGPQFAAGMNLGYPGAGTTPAYGPGYTLAGGASGNVSYTAPIPDTPFSVSVGTHNGNPDAIQSVSANSRVGNLINVSAYANIGTFKQCK